MTELVLNRAHRTRLMQVWRSAGWPCKDGIEIDLLAAGLLSLNLVDGRETLRLTEAGIQDLALSRQRGQRALSAHDRLGQRFAEHLLAQGRIVWRELSLRALIESEAAPQDLTPAQAATLFAEEETPPSPIPNAWRMARPDLFSIRNTTVNAYLQPMVHEIKASRADLLSDLRHAAKRQAYQWLCSECSYVFPVAVAKPNEIPEQFGVWVLHGGIDDGEFEMLRPAHHNPVQLPFAVWMALAKATPLRSCKEDGESGQSILGEAAPPEEAA